MAYNLFDLVCGFMLIMSPFFLAVAIVGVYEELKKK